ncbi:MAG: hypothetical protein HY225_01140 [Candidatus Vogelbacteria bacterium]|nr:hypothetical protein [Candidatus Vogelbacteria bacterium]
MNEWFKYKRIIFVDKTAQQDFLNAIIIASKQDVKHFTASIDISQRSIQNWRNGKTRLPYEFFQKLSIKYRVPVPPVKELISLRDHLKKIGVLGGKQTFKKYLSLPLVQRQRRFAWQKWWDTKGKFSKHPIINVRKKVVKPRNSELLAEFFGIMLGDGGMTKYQITVSLNRHDDKEYIQFVSRLIYKLFQIKPSIIIAPNDPVKKSVASIQLSRRGLVEYLSRRGLVIGNKVRQQAEVPEWIIRNKKFRFACLRGLVDTDGCVYTDTYAIAAREYSYKKIAFTNRSLPLLKFVYDTWLNMGFRPALAKGIDVRLTSQDDVASYLKLVGTNNPKHLKRYKV